MPVVLRTSGHLRVCGTTARSLPSSSFSRQTAATQPPRYRPVPSRPAPSRNEGRRVLILAAVRAIAAAAPAPIPHLPDLVHDEVPVPATLLNRLALLLQSPLAPPLRLTAHPHLLQDSLLLLLPTAIIIPLPRLPQQRLPLLPRPLPHRLLHRARPLRRHVVGGLHRAVEAVAHALQDGAARPLTRQVLGRHQRHAAQPHRVQVQLARRQQRDRRARHQQPDGQPVRELRVAFALARGGSGEGGGGGGRVRGRGGC